MCLRSTRHCPQARLPMVLGKEEEPSALAAGRCFKRRHFTSGHPVDGVALMTGGVGGLSNQPNLGEISIF